MSDPTNPRADELALLLDRVTELEMQNEKLRRLSVWTIVGVAAVLGLGAALVAVGGRRGLPGTVSRAVESQSFVVRDSKGKVRGAWGIADDGSLRFAIQDARGKAGVTVTVLKDGSSGITISDTLGNARAVLGLLPDQTTTLVFADGAGRSRTVLGLAGDGASSLAFADRDGATRAGLALDSRGFGTFTLAERPGTPVQDATPDSTTHP